MCNWFVKCINTHACQLIKFRVKSSSRVRFIVKTIYYKIKLTGVCPHDPLPVIGFDIILISYITKFSLVKYKFNIFFLFNHYYWGSGRGNFGSKFKKYFLNSSFFVLSVYENTHTCKISRNANKRQRANSNQIMTWHSTESGNIQQSQRKKSKHKSVTQTVSRKNASSHQEIAAGCGSARTGKVIVLAPTWQEHAPTLSHPHSRQRGWCAFGCCTSACECFAYYTPLHNNLLVAL